GTGGCNFGTIKPAEPGESAMPPAILLPSSSTAPLFSLAKGALPPLASFTLDSAMEALAPASMDDGLDPAMIPPAISLRAGSTPAPPRIAPRSGKEGGSSFASGTGGSNQEATKPSEGGASAMATAGLVPSNSTAPLFSSAEDVTVLLASFTSSLAVETVAPATVDDTLDPAPVLPLGSLPAGLTVRLSSS